MKKRQVHLDNVSGLMICYMMLMHILLWKKIPLANDSFWLEPLKFFMFWFFFKSGMFFREKPTKVKISGGARKLLVPFVVFSILGYILSVYHLWASCDINWVHYILTPMKEILLAGSIGGNDVLWFLTSLFMVQVLYNELVKRKVRPWLIVVIPLLIAFACHVLGISKPEYLANISLGMVMYSLGYLLREAQYKKNIFLMAFAIYVLIVLFCPSHIDLRTNVLNVDGYYILAILFSIAGCVSINYVFKRLPGIPVINYIGRKSMDFYVMHMLVLGVVTTLPWNQWGISNFVEFMIMCVSCLVIPAIIGRLLENSRFSWMLGK